LIPANTDSPLPWQMRYRAWEEGIHILPRGNLLMLSPPLIVQPEHIEEAMTKLDRLLTWLEQTEKIS
jgi:adenosylmethionine-8-amino-7-oxononanoate aminotransferase